MFEIAEQVDRWRSIGRQVTIARVLETVGLSSRERAAAVALSNGEPVAGSLLSGAMDDKLRAAVAARRISRCGKRLFGTFEARFDFLAARFASLRHAASPRNFAWAANSRLPSLASTHETCGGSAARLPRVPNELPVAITIVP